jgi:hypothetical protein
MVSAEMMRRRLHEVDWVQRSAKHMAKDHALQWVPRWLTSGGCSNSSSPPYDRSKVLGQPDGRCHVVVLALEVREELGIGVGAVLGPLQHKPGRPARGQRLWLPLNDTRERLA